MVELSAGRSNLTACGFFCLLEVLPVHLIVSIRIPTRQNDLVVVEVNLIYEILQDHVSNLMVIKVRIQEFTKVRLDAVLVLRKLLLCFLSLNSVRQRLLASLKLLQAFLRGLAEYYCLYRLD